MQINMRMGNGKTIKQGECLKNVSITLSKYHLALMERLKKSMKLKSRSAIIRQLLEERVNKDG